MSISSRGLEDLFQNSVTQHRGQGRQIPAVIKKNLKPRENQLKLILTSNTQASGESSKLNILVL
jgi:hypothetical protein